MIIVIEIHEISHTSRYFQYPKKINRQHLLLNPRRICFIATPFFSPRTPHQKTAKKPTKRMCRRSLLLCYVVATNYTIHNFPPITSVCNLLQTPVPSVIFFLSLRADFFRVFVLCAVRRKLVQVAVQIYMAIPTSSVNWGIWVLLKPVARRLLIWKDVDRSLKWFLVFTWRFVTV